MIAANPFPAYDDSVAGLVVRDILDSVFAGRYGPSFRLLVERVMAQELDVSRVSVREALHRLRQYGVIAIKRGSGAVIQPQRMWSSSVITHLLLFHLRRGDFDQSFPLIADAFALRRVLLLDIMKRAAGLLEPGALDPARKLLRETWKKRFDIYLFALSDLEMVNKSMEIAGLKASMWTLNSLSEPYLGLVAMVSRLSTMRIPDSYVPAHLEVFAAQEKGDGRAARARMEAFLDELDSAIVDCLPAELSRIPQEAFIASEATGPLRKSKPRQEVRTDTAKEE